MPRSIMKVQLVQHTQDPTHLIALGAKLCYSDADLEKLSDTIEQNDQAKFIAQLASVGHFSTYEHASFSFLIEGVSRTLLAQITRHRIASFSVQSQRYVSQRSEETFAYVLPPSIEALGEEAVLQFDQQMATMQGWYNEWSDQLGKGEGGNEDARFVLPGACTTRMMVTMNARELLHFFSLRCCNRAQWEIRNLAWEMLRLVTKVAPDLFQSAGPDCIQGSCAEGKKTCGKISEVRAKQRTIREEVYS